MTLTDSGPNFGWALLGMTSAAPEGPYTSPELLLHPESLAYHRRFEFFPLLFMMDSSMPLRLQLLEIELFSASSKPRSKKLTCHPPGG